MRRRSIALGAGFQVSQIVMIDDLAGMGLKGASEVFQFMPTMAQMAKIDQLLFPDLLGNMYFINAPSVFTTLWQAMGSLITPGTRQKIKVRSACVRA